MSTTKNAGAVVVRAGEGQAVRWGPGGVVRVIASADATDGSFSIVEATEPPGTAAPLHTHHGEAEAFYVVEGSIAITCGDETVTIHAGDFAYGPKDVAHKYVVVSDTPAKVLLLFSRPGFESFFVDGGSPLDAPPSGPPDPAKMRRLLERYDLELNEVPAH